ncbi:MAG: 6-bladed beta-propeller, partial [Acidobacteriota bacterium]|nr:6-bladed beta-propeller [Acidobacteriota bacterium]
MKKIKVLFLLIVTFFLYSCNKNEYKVKSKYIDFKSISIIKSKTKNILDIGKIKKAVKLETKDNALIGNVDSLIYDKNEDFYIADYYSSKKVFRFDKKGNFVRSYGKIGQGPGEYNSILSFALDSESNVFLLGNYKLIKFDKNGKLLKEIRIKYHSGDIIIVNDLIYISILRYRYVPKNKKAILIIDTNLKKVGEMLTYDTRLEKYLFTPRKMFAKNQDNLYFIDVYDFKLNIFNQKSKEMSCL